MDNAVLEEFLSDDEIDGRLRQRLGSLHARQRLGIERDHEAQVFGQGLKLLPNREFSAFTGIHHRHTQADGSLLDWTAKRRACSRQNE